jgi:PAS domain S-box-containing protein
MDVILKSVGDGLVVTDMHNRIVLMNRAAEDILGVSFSEAIGRPVEYAIEESTFKELTHFIGKSRKNTDYQFDFQHQDRKGKTRHLRARTSVVVDRQGRQRGVVSIMHDVTREREVDRMKSEFISTAAHELRTPMTSIQGFSELLLTRDDFKDDEKRRFMKHINSSAVALSGIISDLLDISRIESGKGLSINPRGLNLKELIEHKIEALTVQFPDYSFVLDMPEKVLPALADPNKIDQVLDNLLSNAVKYSPEKGEIRVALECSGLEQSVSVADSGQGMTPEQVDRVFEKFYRGGAANSGVPGTGLGMSIVRHIVEAHGGKVRVKSDHGRGTTVSFSLPACGGAALPPGVAEYVPG